MKHREVKGKIKQVEIKKGIDKWYAIITTDHKREIESGDKVWDRPLWRNLPLLLVSK